MCPGGVGDGFQVSPRKQLRVVLLLAEMGKVEASPGFAWFHMDHMTFVLPVGHRVQVRVSH